MSQVGRVGRYIRCQAEDNVAWLTWTALAGLAGAALLALVGVPPIDLHGPLHRFGIMDPACGGTRSVYLFLHGDIGRSIQYNPAAPLVVLAAAAAVAVRAVVGRLAGKWVAVALQRRTGFVAALVVVVALEINQQAHADLLTTQWDG